MMTIVFYEPPTLRERLQRSWKKVLKRSLFGLAIASALYFGISHKNKESLRPECLPKEKVSKLEKILDYDFPNDVCIVTKDERGENFEKIIDNWESFKESVEKAARPGECAKAVRIAFNYLGKSYRDLEKWGYAGGSAWHILGNLRLREGKIRYVYSGNKTSSNIDSLIETYVRAEKEFNLGPGDLVFFYYPGSHYNNEARKVLGKGREATHLGLVIAEVKYESGERDYIVFHNFPGKKYKGFSRREERIRLDLLNDKLLRQRFEGYELGLLDKIKSHLRHIFRKREPKSPYQKGDGILYIRALGSK